MTPALVKKGVESVIQSGNYGNFAAKGYTLASHVDRIELDNVRFNQANSAIIFENFDKLIFEQKPKITDVVVCVGKVKVTVKETANTAKAVTLCCVRSDDTLIQTNNYGPQLFSVEYNHPVSTSYECNGITIGMNTFVDSYGSFSETVSHNKYFLISSIFNNQIGGSISQDGAYSKNLAFYTKGYTGNGNANVLFEDISIWYR